jgi:hypothetical protein
LDFYEPPFAESSDFPHPSPHVLTYGNGPSGRSSSPPKSNHDGSSTPELTDPHPVKNLNTQFNELSQSAVVGYSRNPPELYDLSEFEEELIPVEIDDNVRQAVTNILKAKVNKIKEYMKEIERCGNGTPLQTKFTKDSSYETWHYNFCSELTTLTIW